MARKYRKYKKRKGKIKFKKSVALVPKDSVKRDTTVMPIMQARPPADVAPVFKVKIRKKQ